MKRRHVLDSSGRPIRAGQGSIGWQAADEKASVPPRAASASERGKRAGSSAGLASPASERVAAGEWTTARSWGSWQEYMRAVSVELERRKAGGR